MRYDMAVIMKPHLHIYHNGISLCNMNTTVTYCKITHEELVILQLYFTICIELDIVVTLTCIDSDITD